MQDPRLLNQQTSPWIIPLRRSPNAGVRLICFPYAGGSASLYRRWLPHLPAEVDLCAIQLPGRESRFVDPLCDEPQTLVRALDSALTPYLDRPIVLFGYSMGGLIAHALASYWQTQNRPAHLQRLVIAACAAPKLGTTFDPEKLSAKDFLDYVQSLGGTPPEVFEHAELVELMLPMLKSDFRLVFRFRQQARGTDDKARLACAATILSATNDEHALPEDVDAWRDYFTSAVKFESIAGGHFALWENSAELVHAALA